MTKVTADNVTVEDARVLRAALRLEIETALGIIRVCGDLIDRDLGLICVCGDLIEHGLDEHSLDEESGPVGQRGRVAAELNKRDLGERSE